MKKVLVICGMCMLLLLCSTTVWGAKIGESYFADDFENQTGWESLAAKGWESLNGGCVKISEDGKPGNGKCAVVNALWRGSLDALFTQSPTGTVGITFDMQMNKRCVDGVYFLRQGKKSADGGLEYLLNFAWKDGTYGIYAYDGDIFNSNPLFTLQQGQWINVKMILDMSGNKYSVWITDENGVSKNIIFNKNIALNNDLGGIVFHYPNYGLYVGPETDVGDFKLDNFDMYEEIPEEYEDFERANTFADDLQPYGWWSTNSGPLSIATEGEGASANRFLQFKSLYNSEAVKYFPAPQTENLIVEFKVKTEGITTYLRMRDDKNEQYPTILEFASADEQNDKLTPAGIQGNVVTYPKGKWITVKIVIDREANKWYCSLSPDANGVEYAVFSADIPLQALTGLQFGYPGDGTAADIDTAKAFCLDELRVTTFTNVHSYNIAAAVTTADGTPIATKESLLSAKGANPITNVKVTREYYGEMTPAYVVCALYQDGQLLSMNLNKEFAMSGMEKAKTIPSALDFSEINGEGGIIEVKAFLWQGNNLIPLTSAGNKVFE